MADISITTKIDKDGFHKFFEDGDFWANFDKPSSADLFSTTSHPHMTENLIRLIKGQSYEWKVESLETEYKFNQVIFFFDITKKATISKAFEESDWDKLLDIGSGTKNKHVRPDDGKLVFELDNSKNSFVFSAKSDCPDITLSYSIRFRYEDNIGTKIFYRHGSIDPFIKVGSDTDPLPQ